MFRNIVIFVGFTIFLVGVSGCVTSGKNVNALSMQEDGETLVYEVFGMDCPVCHGGLEKLVMKIPGVKYAEANWQEKQIEVIVESGYEVSDQMIDNAVKKANFSLGKRIQ